MKALITGASGFVGHHLALALREEGVEVTGIGHHPSATIAGDYHCVDLLDEAAVRSFAVAEFGWIFHLAGLAAVGPSFDHPRRYIDANAGMQINLLESVIRSGATPRVLIISTGNLYAATKLPFTEDSPITATSPYAISKITQEYLARYYEKRQLETIIARPFNHIGPGQAEGFLISDLTKQIVEAELSQQPCIKVGNLSSCRDYTDVRDIVKAYIALMQHGHPGEVYNVCSGTSRSGQEILEELLTHSKSKIRVEPDPELMRPSDTPNLYGSHDKLTRDTGWQPQTPLTETLTDVMADWRQRLAG